MTTESNNLLSQAHTAMRRKKLEFIIEWTTITKNNRDRFVMVVVEPDVEPAS